MTDNQIDGGGRSRRLRLGMKLALLGGGIAAGVIGASAVGAGAQTGTGTVATASSSTATLAPSAPTGAPGQPDANDPANRHGAAPVRSDEKVVSASDQAILKAAALKAVPGGTVYRIETDAGDGAYEAHMTKADGTEVTVKFDKNLALIKVEAGMGAGDPAPANRPANGGGPGH